LGDPTYRKSMVINQKPEVVIVVVVAVVVVMVVIEVAPAAAAALYLMCVQFRVEASSDPFV